MSPESKTLPERDLLMLSRGGLSRPLAPGDGAGAAPSVPRPPFRWKTRILLPTILLAGTALLLGWTARDALWPATPVRVIPVVVKTGADTGGGAVTVQASGWVEADPYAVAVSALADGVVEEVLVLEGQPVEAGQVVARLVDDDARLALARAEAELADAEAELRAAQRTWESPVELNRAAATTEALAREAEAELAKLTTDVAAEAARAAELRDQFQRTQNAYEAGGATEGEYVQSKQRLMAQEAAVAAAKARRPVLEAQLAARAAERVAADENLRLRISDASALDKAKAAVALGKAKRDEAELRLRRMEVRSPAGGVVLARHVQPGSKLMLGMDHPGSAYAVTLYDPRRLQVRVDIPLADAAKVGVGQGAKVVVGVLPDRTFEGVVSRIVQEADVQKNTLQVKVAIKDPSPELKPEMLARVKFIATTDSAAAPKTSQIIFAPEALIRRDGGEAKAWAIDAARGVATLRRVELGDATHEGWVAVRSGLQAGDRLIAGDVSNLREGQKITVVGEADVAVGPPDAKGGQGHGAH